MTNIITFLTNFWNWFNANKMHIGAIILSVLAILTAFDAQVIVGIWGLVIPTAITKLISTLNWIGVGLTGAGIVHGGVKTLSVKTPVSTNVPKGNSDNRISQ